MANPYLEYLAEADSVLSRTAITGIVALDASLAKRAVLSDQNTLRIAVAANRQRVAELVEARVGVPPTHSGEMMAALISLAALTNHCIAMEATFRRWEYDHLKYVDIGDRAFVTEIDVWPRLLRTVADAFDELRARPSISAIACLEWDLMFGPLHPFYDATGRISRAFSLLLCAWYGQGPRTHEARAQYMAAGAQGREAFAQYYEARPISKWFAA